MPEHKAQLVGIVLQTNLVIVGNITVIQFDKQNKTKTLTVKLVPIGSCGDHTFTTGRLQTIQQCGGGRMAGGGFAWWPRMA